jgi:predicted dehydrogenase
MHRGTLSRRGFLEGSMTTALAAGLPLWAAREYASAADAKPAEKDGSPSDKIIMGAIGIGSPASRGRAIYGDAKRSSKAVQYVAACDVDARHLKQAVEVDLVKGGDKDATGYKDFRELLDRKDITAVTIATPDHWHALVAIEAMRKGKDVYCEKPLTLTIAEAIAVMEAVKKYKRVFQTGSQQRSDGRFRMACELVRNGRIGKLKRVECRIGGNPTSDELPVVPVPEGLDWDFWLGPTPKVDYVQRGNQSRCHYEFRWWYDYSGGKMTDWGAHHIDIAQWGMGRDGSGPSAIEVISSTPPSGKPNSYNCHPKFQLRYTYDDGVEMIVSDGTVADTVGDKDGNGVLFVGEGNQWIFVNRGKITASDKKLLEEPLSKDAKRLQVSNNHMGNFLECLRTRELPICNADVGGGSVIVCHLGAIALRLGKKLTWDPTKRRFVDNDQANAMLSREMRAPWKLEV